MVKVGIMGRTERLEQPDIDAVIEAERQGGHPLGHRAVVETLEVTPLAQQEFERTVYGRG